MSFPLSNDESSRVPGTAGCQFAGGLPDSGYLVPLAPDYLSGYRFAADGRHVAMYQVPDYRYLTIPGTRLSVLSINPWPLCTRYRYPVIHYVPDTAMYQVPLSGTVIGYQPAGAVYLVPSPIQLFQPKHFGELRQCIGDVDQLRADGHAGAASYAGVRLLVIWHLGDRHRGDEAVGLIFR